MLEALGIQADWRLIHGEPDCFAITKAFHKWRARIASSKGKSPPFNWLLSARCQATIQRGGKSWIGWKSKPQTTRISLSSRTSPV
jgi:hypothetical protein